MDTNPLTDALTPDVQTVFSALTSDDCRRVIRSLDRPMTAQEVADTCELPRSTAYRKLDDMVEAGLLERRESGREAATYALAFDEVVVSVTEDGSRDLDVSVSRQSRTASQQLSNMWDAVRAERDRG
jgi:predicted transcriptional regulator